MNNSAKKAPQGKKRTGISFGAVVVILIALALIAVAVNWGRIIAPLKDAALDVDGGTFPVSLPGSTGYGLYELGDNICLLTDTYIYTYNSDGANIAGIQHGLQNPAVSANDKRVMVYDKSGKGIKFFSRSAEIYSVTVEDTIVFGQIGTADKCAVVTTSTRYANTLYIFNGEGKQVYRYSSPTKKIMQACFSEDESEIFLTLMDEKNGELLFSAAKLDLSSAQENYQWETQLSLGVTYSVQLCSDGLYIVGSDGHCLLDKQSGEEIAFGAFSGYIADIPECDDLRVVVFNDSASNGFIAAAYNEQFEAEYTLSGENAAAFYVEGGMFYLLSGTKLTAYNSSFEAVKEYEFDNAYSDFLIRGKSAYLLGYNTVQKIAL